MDSRETRVESEGSLRRFLLRLRQEVVVAWTRLLAAEWSSSEYILKVEPAGFLLDGLDVG